MAACLAAGQAGRLQERLQKVFAVAKFLVEGLDLLGLGLEFLVLSRQFLGLLR